MRVGVRRLPLAAALAVLGAALLPGAAHAAFSITSFTATTNQAPPATGLYTQAGGVPYTGVTSVAFGGNPAAGEAIRNLRVDVPAGLITNIASVPTCLTDAVASCTTANQIGVVGLTVPTGLAPPAPPTTTIVRPVYNMTPPAGRISRFGFQGVTGDVSILGGVRFTGDYGTYFEINDIPPPSAGPPAVPPILATSLTFFGNPADPGHGLVGATDAAFLRLPTACGPPYTTRVTATAWNGQTVTDDDTTPTGATGCDRVPFTPSIDVTPSTTKRDSPAGADITIDVPSVTDPDEIVQSHVRNTTVTLPDGMTINPAVANGLQTCSDAQFGKGTDNPVACPDAARVGTARIDSPAIPTPLTGTVWLGDPQPGNPYRIFLQATGAGVDTRLIGDVKADPQTGRLTTTFADTPQTPFTRFRISMTAGPRAVFATPLACGPGESTSVLTPWSGQANATPGATTAPFDENGSGAPCNGTPFAPAFGASTTSSQAAGDTSFTADVTRPDGQQFLGRLTVTQPKGLLGRIPLVPQCSNADAAAGKCPESSRIGTASVLAGAGSTPYPLSGPVYLTGAYNGAPFGLAIVIRAVAGPYDLGTVVVRAGLRIDPLTAAITVDSDALPTILQGIPLRLREVKVTIDKQGFLFNGTECGPQFASGSSTSTGGATSGASATVPVTGCEKLSFSPAMSAVTGGRPSKARGASLFVTVKQPAGQVNLRQVSVKLPRGFAARGTTLQQACLRETFNADPSKCPAGSRVGTANAVTPTLPFQLPGTAYLVARNGALPTLEVLLSKDLVNLRLSSLIAYDKRYISTFQNIPDAPVTSFQLDQPQGKNSSLSWTTGDICSHRLTMPTTFTGWDGRKLNQTTRITAANCPVKILAVRGLRGGKARVTLRIPERGKLTLSGKGIRRTTRSFRTAAKAATVTIQRSSTSVRSTRVTARFVPTNSGKPATSSAPVRLTPSVSTAAVRFPRGAATGPTFTG